MLAYGFDSFAVGGDAGLRQPRRAGRRRDRCRDGCVVVGREPVVALTRRAGGGDGRAGHARLRAGRPGLSAAARRRRWRRTRRSRARRRSSLPIVLLGGRGEGDRRAVAERGAGRARQRSASRCRRRGWRSRRATRVADARRRAPSSIGSTGSRSSGTARSARSGSSRRSTRRRSSRARVQPARRSIAAPTPVACRVPRPAAADRRRGAARAACRGGAGALGRPGRGLFGERRLRLRAEPRAACGPRCSARRSSRCRRATPGSGCGRGPGADRVGQPAEPERGGRAERRQRRGAAVRDGGRLGGDPVPATAELVAPREYRLERAAARAGGDRRGRCRRSGRRARDFVLLDGAVAQLELAGVGARARAALPRRAGGRGPTTTRATSHHVEAFAGVGLRPYRPAHLRARRRGDGGIALRLDAAHPDRRRQLAGRGGAARARSASSTTLRVLRRRAACCGRSTSRGAAPRLFRRPSRRRTARRRRSSSRLRRSRTGSVRDPIERIDFDG